MKHRDRVYTALAHEIPDRAPMQISFVPEFAARLRAELKLRAQLLHNPHGGGNTYELERALGEIRNFIGAFRPPGFERRSLGEIIEGLVVQHETLTDQEVALGLDPELGDCVLPIKIALYRILQEALANGFHHSGAAHQRVALSRQGDVIALTVADDGRGFDPAAVLARPDAIGRVGLARTTESMPVAWRTEESGPVVRGS